MARTSSEASMTRRRRCEVCRELFTADPRVGKRQYVCGARGCQRERHRQNCVEARNREKPIIEAEKFRSRLVGPQNELRTAAVRDECGAKVEVIVREALIFVVGALRDECPRRFMDVRRDVLRYGGAGPRDETADPRAPP